MKCIKHGRSSWIVFNVVYLARATDTVRWCTNYRREQPFFTYNSVWLYSLFRSVFRLHIWFFFNDDPKIPPIPTDRICFMRAFLMKAIQFWPVKQLEHFESKNRFCGAIWKNLWKKTMQHHPSKCIHQTNENWKCGVLIYSFHFALPRYWNGFMLPNLILFVWFSSSASLLILAEHSRRMRKKNQDWTQLLIRHTNMHSFHARLSNGHANLYIWIKIKWWNQ